MKQSGIMLQKWIAAMVAVVIVICFTLNWHRVAEFNVQAISAQMESAGVMGDQHCE